MIWLLAWDMRDQVQFKVGSYLDACYCRPTWIDKWLHYDHLLNGWNILDASWCQKIGVFNSHFIECFEEIQANALDWSIGVACILTINLSYLIRFYILENNALSLVQIKVFFCDNYLLDYLLDWWLYLKNTTIYNILIKYTFPTNLS